MGAVHLKLRGSSKGKKHPLPPSAVTAAELCKPTREQVAAAVAWLDKRNAWDEVRR